jgi:hypothetical protein
MDTELSKTKKDDSLAGPPPRPVPESVFRNNPRNARSRNLLLPSAKSIRESPLRTRNLSKNLRR